MDKPNSPKSINYTEYTIWIRVASIQPLKQEAMVTKIGACEIFQQSQLPKQPQQEDVPSEAYEDLHDIQVEEILEEKLRTSPRPHIHYHVSIGNESYSPSNDSNRSNPIASLSIS